MNETTADQGGPTGPGGTEVPSSSSCSAAPIALSARTADGVWS